MDFQSKNEPRDRRLENCHTCLFRYARRICEV
jgi:hypothetical protein